MRRRESPFRSAPSTGLAAGTPRAARWRAPRSAAAIAACTPPPPPRRRSAAADRSPSLAPLGPLAGAADELGDLGAEGDAARRAGPQVGVLAAGARNDAHLAGGVEALEHGVNDGEVVRIRREISADGADAFAHIA